MTLTWFLDVMVKPLIKFLRLRYLFLSLLCAPGLAAQTGNPSDAVLVPEEDPASRMELELRNKWALEGITTAIRCGFLDVAETLSSRLLETGNLTDAQFRQLYNSRLHIALVMGDMDAAGEALAQIRERGLAADPLLEAYYDFFSGEPQTAARILSSLDRETLQADRQAWARVLDALILTRNGQTEEANEAFLMAERLAPTALLRDQLEIIRYREELASGAYDEGTISALRESVRSMRGERGGFEAARLLAIALYRAGETNAAIEVLSTHLAMPGLRENNLRPEFLLLLGNIAGPDSQRGRLALEQIVSEQADPQLQSIALTLLAQSVSTDAERTAFLDNVRSWLERIPPHPLSDRLLAYQAYFLARNQSFDRAEARAQELLERFPTSSFIPSALRLLAFTSWNQAPPRYRTAADYLNRLRQRIPASPEAFEAGVLIADCYFLNGDYANASNAYGAMLMEAGPEQAPSIFFQRVLSEIRAERPNIAAELIDAAREDPRLDQEVLWKADWNLLDYLRRNGRTPEAFQRIRKILGQPSPEEPVLPPDMELRFRWLEARLMLEAGSADEAVDMATALLDEVDAGELPVSRGEWSQVESHLLLLLGEAQLTAGLKADGLATFSILREKYPRTGQSILSYLVESRVESDEDNLVSAQQSLVALADRFPNSEYAPIALWEAALNAEQRGLNIHLQEAITILERLVTEYPSHDLVYYARIKQGDLARRLNDFPTALLLYERVLSQFPNHPQRYRAELSRADCLMALGSEDPARFDMAAVIYERNCILPTAPLAVRVESGFKWAHALNQEGDPDGSEAVLWLLYERFVLDEDLGQSVIHDDAGRYWVARVLIELGNVQVAKGDIASARQVFDTHQQMNLPGAALVQARLDSLQ